MSTDSEPGEAPPFVLWFDHPAREWAEAFPIGNGRLGGMVFGGVEVERIQLNEQSLWSGSPQEADNPAGREALPEIRRLLFAGRYVEAQELTHRTMICRGQGSGFGEGAELPYGSYQTLGDLTLRLVGAGRSEYPEAGDAEGYRHELDLDAAVARTSFSWRGVSFVRELFSSRPAQVMVLRLTADQPGGVSVQLALSRLARALVGPVGSDGLVMRGRTPDGRGGEGLTFQAQVRVACEGAGGRIEPGGDGCSLVIRAADAITVLLAARTNHDLGNPPTYLRGDPGPRVREELDAAAALSFAELKRAHVAEHRRLYRRAFLDLGGHDRRRLPTDRRLADVVAGASDPDLVATIFALGRYLLISSSRPGGLPANLQGIWSDGLQAAWNADYHNNINVQMNYWPAEVTNLAECHQPLFDYIEYLRGPGRRTAATQYGVGGWVTHTITNVWGFTSPGEKASWGLSNAAGWLCAHLWEHYAFSLDQTFLERAYPAMKEAATWYLDSLVPEPRQGYLVIAPSISPENSFVLPSGEAVSVCHGPTIDSAIARELLTNTANAARILNRDEELVRRLDEARERLPPFQIGRWGNVREWLEDFDEWEPGHRHISHLYGLYPGNQVTPTTTPELAVAARRTLQRRLEQGGAATGWSRAWLINFWARLGEGERLFESVQALLAQSTLPNLFDYHPPFENNAPPFQIDGNFGSTAGIAEALVQSHEGFIALLPALPRGWPSGRVCGLRARGGFEIDVTWQNGRMIEAEIRASVDGVCRIRLPDGVVALRALTGHGGAAPPLRDHFLELSTTSGGAYRLVPVVSA